MIDWQLSGAEVGDHVGSLSGALKPHLSRFLVLARPQELRMPHHAIGGPIRVRDFGYQARLRPMGSADVVTWDPGERWIKGRSLKSLLLGYYDRGCGLVFAGKAGARSSAPSNQLASQL